MSSQFKNSSLGFYLYTFLIVIIVAAVAFVFWFMITGYKLGTYDENTLLGSVYVGGLKEEDVEPLMTTRIDRWLGDESILFEVKYQGYSYTMDRELFDFDLDKSINRIKAGKTNELEVTYLDRKKANIISELQSLVFLQDIKDNINYDLIISDVLRDASLMKSYSVKNIEKYLIDKEASSMVVASETFYIPNNVNMTELLEDIAFITESDGITIKNDYYYDIIDELGDELDDKELGFLSSAMLKLIHQTNFSINEVHYENKIDLVNYTVESFPYYGNNSIVFKRENNSFSFYNPNQSSYTFEFLVDGDQVTVSLKGLAFVNQIENEIRKQSIDHVVKYTELPQQVKSGADGVVVEVVRTIRDVYGNKISATVIVDEFYPPEVEIILN